MEMESKKEKNEDCSQNGSVDKKEQPESSKCEDKLKWNEKSLPDKHFMVRDSLLTELFQNPHIKTIYHIFVALLMGLFLNAVVRDYIMKKEIDLGFGMIYDAFGKLYIALIGWVIFYGLTCLSFFCLKFWAHVRMECSPKSNNRIFWDSFCFFVIGCYYIFSFRLAANIVTIFSLPPASAAIILLEQTRLLMKVHAFLRGNVPKVLRFKTHSEEELKLPTFNHFVYFTFVPTLVYRDEYPRTKTINWRFVTIRAVEVIGVIFYFSFLLDRFVVPLFSDFGKRKYSYGEIILTIFESSITGVLLLLCGFYLILHSWLNLFAEILRFGDRLFYKDWWTVTSYSAFYRTWNVVVHDWLYIYVYKDFYENIVPNNKLVAKFSVFAISAVVHEWVLTYMFGYFLLALFLEFMVLGTFLTFFVAPKNSVLNILFWYGLAFGSGSLVSLYSLEFYARKNTLPSTSGYDFYSPRFLNCDCIF